MENKKILNRIILFFSALIIITFSVFYKDLIAITVDNKWIKILYFIVIYLSIACTAVGLIISLACGFKDEYDIIWFVQFLNLCAFLLTTITALAFAINLSTTITTAYFFFCLEYFLLNSINMVFQTIKNFKFFKKDMKSVFTNGEPDKSYRYGLESDSKKEELATKELKSEKYDLIQDEENQLEKEENDEKLSADALVKEEDVTNNENTIEAVNEEKLEEFKEDKKNDISIDDESETLTQFEDNKNTSTNSGEIDSNNSTVDNKSSDNAKELSDTITFLNDDEDNDLNEISSEKINEIQKDVDRIIEENKKKSTDDESKNEELTNDNLDNSIVFNSDVKNEISEDFTYINEDDIIKDEPQKDGINLIEENENNKGDDSSNTEENSAENFSNIENINAETETLSEEADSSTEGLTKPAKNTGESDLNKEKNDEIDKKTEAKSKEKETKASKISILNKFISR